MDTATYIYPGMCALLVYVDDIIGGCLSDSWWDRFRNDFGIRFNIKDLGNAHWVLGMEVQRDRNTGTLTLNQRQYLTALLEKHDMADCHAVLTPCTPAEVKDTAPSPPFTNVPVYQSIVGSLLYASGGTRPDLTYAVNRLARHMSAPTQAHWASPNRVLSMLKVLWIFLSYMVLRDSGTIRMLCAGMLMQIIWVTPQSSLALFQVIFFS